MKKLIIMGALIFASPVFASPAFAAELTTDTFLGTNMTDIRSTLTDMGYEVRKSEMEDGNIEVYFVHGNQMGEVYVSMATGKVTRLKMK